MESGGVAVVVPGDVDAGPFSPNVGSPDGDGGFKQEELDLVNSVLTRTAM